MTFIHAYSNSLGTDLKTTELKIQGMTCNHCVMSLRKELSHLDGIEIQDVSIGRAVVVSDGTLETIKRLRDAVEAAGYSLIEG